MEDGKDSSGMEGNGSLPRDASVAKGGLANVVSNVTWPLSISKQLAPCTALGGKVSHFCIGHVVVLGHVKPAVILNS